MLVAYILVFFGVSSIATGIRFMELNEHFPEARKSGGYWLIKFYAPWCVHCKTLEPVWEQVSDTLSNTEIRVGRVDCDRFRSVAAQFSIRGYPTIKFLTADAEYTFNGDRTKEDILSFAIRLAGPPVQVIRTSELLKQHLSYNKHFFVYVGSRVGPLWQTYLDLATKMQPHSFFYSVEEEIASEHMDIDQVPVILVHKENETFQFLENENVVHKASNLSSALMKWINEERFGTFPKVTRGNMKELTETHKYIVLAIIDGDKQESMAENMLSFRHMVEDLVRNNRAKYQKNFQFGWIGKPDLANSIAMQVLPLPSLMVLNSTNFQYHIPDRVMTAKDIEDFLQQILDEKVPVYGGNGMFVRFYRVYFDTSRAVIEMWYGNPILTGFLFGLPLSFFTFILYSVCCADISDPDVEEDQEEDIHSKKD